MYKNINDIKAMQEVMNQLAGVDQSENIKELDEIFNQLQRELEETQLEFDFMNCTETTEESDRPKSPVELIHQAVTEIMEARDTNMTISVRDKKITFTIEIDYSGVNK